MGTINTTKAQGGANNVLPFLKWAGGKRQLLPQLIKYRPAAYTQYCEPFLGGGALLFHLQPPSALVNDINPELINVYQQIRDNVHKLIASLKRHKTDEAYFYKVRGQDRSGRYSNMSPLRRASRVIFLNKTCFNGLYRVNSQGQFNVPYGKYKNPNIVNESTLLAVSAYLQSSKITFTCTSFPSLEKSIMKQSFVYVDPPYHPVSNTASFTGYASNGFSEADQVRLQEFCERLIVDKNCFVLISNSYTNFIRKLYSTPRFELNKIEALRSINSVGKMRGKVPEALIVGRPKL
jgi:DNA adenine methylase